MKTSRLLPGILFLTICISLSCHREPGYDLKLIQPEEGEVFDAYPPEFIWSSCKDVDEYVILVAKENFSTGKIIYRDTLSDTTCSMPEDSFRWALNGEYVWSVTPAMEDDQRGWWKFRSFNINKPPLELSLDSTYFPLGYAYKWVYEQHYWGRYYDPEKEYDWDELDTFTISVIDSTFDGEILEFSISGGSFRDGDPETAQEQTITLHRNRIFVFGKYLIPLIPPLSTEGLLVEYEDSVLHMTVEEHEYYGPASSEQFEWTTFRIKGTGVIKQGYYRSYTGHGCGDDHNIEDRLLYFIKGEDTVWSAD